MIFMDTNQIMHVAFQLLEILRVLAIQIYS
jgi:hypothetical protein